MTLTFSSPEGILLHTEVQVYPDGAAFRYSGNWGDTTITKENTAFKIKPGVRAWMQTYDKPLGGAPAYEKPYSRVISGTSADKIRTNNGWCLPALFEPAAGRFLLIADADVRENYCGIRLESKCDNGLYRVRFPADGDAKGYGSVYPSVSGAFSSPWRVLIAGDLTTVFGSTLVTDVSAPLDPIFNGIYPGWVKPGRSAWNWGHYHNIRYRWNTRLSTPTGTHGASILIRKSKSWLTPPEMSEFGCGTIREENTIRSRKRPETK